MEMNNFPPSIRQISNFSALSPFYLNYTGNGENIDLTDDPLNTVNSSVITTRDSESKPVAEVVSFCIASLFVVLLNLRVICIILEAPERKLRPISVFVAHLSCIAITSSFVFGAYAIEKLKIIGKRDQASCMFLSYLRNLIYAVYPFNIIAIVYERLWTFRSIDGKLLVGRTIGFIWAISLVQALPALAVVKFKVDSQSGIGMCHQVPVFGSVTATISYAFLRFVALHAIPVAYLAHSLYKLRSKIKFLYIMSPIPNRRIIGNVRRLRFVYSYSVLFLLVWFPTGFIVLGYSVLSRYQVDFSNLKPWLALLFVFNYGFLILSPLLFLYLNEDNAKIHLFGTCRRNGNSEVSSNSGTVNEDPQAVVASPQNETGTYV